MHFPWFFNVIFVFLAELQVLKAQAKGVARRSRRRHIEKTIRPSPYASTPYCINHMPRG